MDADAAAMACGPIAVDQVRQFGGVLEHPFRSHLWDYCGIPNPSGGVDRFGGFTLELEQGHFGHPMPKPSWFYCVRVDASRIRRFGRSQAFGSLKRMASSERHFTPPAMAEALVEVARTARGRSTQETIFGEVAS